MTSLLRRAAATCTGLAASGLCTLSQAQDTAVVRERTDLRRALPAAAAAAPIIQQSPNGLYKLSITDAGIELRGPKGVVKITDMGIKIGDPQTTRVEIHSTDMTVRAGNGVRLEAGAIMEIRGGATVDLKGGATVQMTTGSASMKLEPAGASLLGTRVTLGCTNGKQAARIGDQVNTSASPAVVAQGSPTVLVC